MNNPEIDFVKVFQGPFYPLTLEGLGEAAPCPGQPVCPPLVEAAITMEPLCTCTAEDHAYREGAERMRREILGDLERLLDSGECRCDRCLCDLVKGVEW